MWGPSPSATARLAAAALALLAGGGARACEVAITRGPGEVVLRYDPFDAQNAPAEMAVTVRNRDAEACQFDIALVDGDRMAQRRLVLAPSGLEIEVRAAGAGAALLSDGAEPGVWRGSAPAGGEQEYRFTAVVVKDAVPPAGRLELPLGLELRTPGSAAALATAMPVSLAIDSPPRAQLNIAGATGYFGAAPSISTIDLGPLAAGVRRRLFLQVRSNVAVSRLTIRSEHRGLLMPGGEATGGDAEGVPYHVVLGDEPVSLLEPVERRIPAAPTLAGESLPFEIVVDEFGARMAGDYSDVVSIDLSPL